ncbi:hypothetical protein OMO38_17255 [Chryseobacterium sp. 09-1422]|uniref:Uncharacterized protein n=1 Tax=Chryseobacterium kimseyorum TaxID=2984028 RepID=A0ABT3I2K1_9FLAO|nr:hypothetical protein [Chryseobacterium kimseyorum]MCW3170279.1 hypothetical protein [Chryseobacterium kimseyorum]
MNKIMISIITVYLLYYAGNTIYDLYLKKDNSKKKDDTEEYSFKEFVDGNADEITEVSIDDVENINTPQSFNKKELFSDAGESLDENNDLEYWRNKFESEKDVDSFDERSQVNQQPEKTVKIAISDESDNFQEEVVVDQHASKYEFYQKQFYQFLNLAETSVQVLADRDGYKVYQSII